MSTAPEPGLVPSAASTDEADRAILRTVVYSSLFQSPLTVEQLHRSLMDVPLDPNALRRRLDRPYLKSRLVATDGYVHLPGREAWVSGRRQRRLRTRQLLDRHQRFLRLLAGFPFVRLLALTGACAHDNATDDDVDVFLVVKRGRAWAVTLALMILAKLTGRRRTLCMNYVVDEDALALPEHDPFTASEIVGMRPLAGGETYRSFIQANGWVADRHPNFFASHVADAARVPEAGGPRGIERLLDLGPAPLLEALARRVLGPYLRRKARGCAGVVLTPHRLKLHTHDHRPGLMAAFERALREVDPEAAP
jgi:hypothetical protein